MLGVMFGLTGAFYNYVMAILLWPKLWSAKLGHLAPGANTLPGIINNKTGGPLPQSLEHKYSFMWMGL
jgi:hypothetical protein